MDSSCELFLSCVFNLVLACRSVNWLNPLQPLDLTSLCIVFICALFSNDLVSITFFKATESIIIKHQLLQREVVEHGSNLHVTYLILHLPTIWTLLPAKK